MSFSESAKQWHANFADLRQACNALLAERPELQRLPVTHLILCTTYTAERCNPTEDDERDSRAKAAKDDTQQKGASPVATKDATQRKWPS